MASAGLFFVLILVSASAAPAAGDAQAVDKTHAAIALAVEKALEVQGGSRIVFKVDAAALREVVATDLRDAVVRIVREDRIPFAGLAIRDGGVELRIADANNRQRLVSKLAPPTPAASSGGKIVDAADSGDGLIRLTPTDSSFAERLRRLVGESVDMIEQDLRSSGIQLVGVQPDGPDRIRVLLPGIGDPERVSALIARKAQIAFRLVDVSMDAKLAVKNGPPAGSEVLYDFKDKSPYLLLKEVAVDGDDIIDAAPGFATSSEQPIANFRFNARGTRRFAHVTQDNIGRPFAIVIDDQVVSAPLIREPITGGSGQISGNFTLEEANIIAMRLRSGTLPGRLSVVDQQIVEPAKSSK
jgi:preprotein translocase subunit SecD